MWHSTGYGALGLTLLTLSSSLRQGIPPTHQEPRERAAWQQDRRANLMAGTVPQRFPEAWGAWWDRTAQRRVQICDVATATRLLDELYQDYGNPFVNRANQNAIILTVSDMAESWGPDRLLPAGAEQLLEGLRAYAGAGGGRTNPSTQAKLANALAQLGPDDPKVQRRANELLTDAVLWADTVGAALITQEVIADCARQQWGDAFEQRYLELLMGEPPARDASPKPYRRAIEALMVMLEEPDPERLPAHVRDAAEAAGADCGDAELNADLLARLLLAWDLLLTRPDLPDKAAEFIAQHLRRLAGDSRGLSSERHWALWARAVRALGYQRAPEAIGDQIARTLRDPDMPPERRSLLEQTLASIRP